MASTITRPTGAPVVSVAPGVVTMAGWTGGGGRTVKVRHANGYETEYLHLSAIAVRAGARIGQGDLVGRVGKTGLATGPHLHYGLKKNGRYVNPIVEHRNMPPGEPVPAALLNVFTSSAIATSLCSPARPHSRREQLQPTESQKHDCSCLLSLCVSVAFCLYRKVQPTPNLKSGESITPILNSKNRPRACSTPIRRLNPASVSESSIVHHIDVQRRSAAGVDAPSAAARELVDEFHVGGDQREVVAEAHLDVRTEVQPVDERRRLDVAAEIKLIGVNRQPALDAGILGGGAE